MQSPREVVVRTLAAQAYAAGLVLHGEIDLELEAYTSHLIHVVKKHSSKDPTSAQVLAVFSQLHTNDLYLSVACAHGSETAWNRFWSIYRKHACAVASSICHRRGDASDLADETLTHLFLPGGSGRSRIGSYEGVSSLATWLAYIIHHQAAKERDRKCNHFERLDDLPDIADYSAIDKVENELRASIYGPSIKDSFIQASKRMNERERWMLVLRYERGEKGAEIARALHVHPSTITRQVQHTCDKLGDRIISMLTSRLNSSAVEECVAEILENPGYWSPVLMKPEDPQTL